MTIKTRLKKVTREAEARWAEEKRAVKELLQTWFDTLPEDDSLAVVRWSLFGEGRDGDAILAKYQLSKDDLGEPRPDDQATYERVCAQVPNDLHERLEALETR